MAGVFAVVIVVAISDAARTIGGAVAARWSAWTAFALASSSLLGAQNLDGEIAAGAFVSLCVAGTLRATTVENTTRGRRVLAAAAGAAAAMAVLMKQNFVDGFAFAGVLLGIAC